MDIIEKKAFILNHSDEFIDQYFGIQTITDLNYEGPQDLYLQGLDPRALYTSYQDLIEVMLVLYKRGLRSWCDVGCGIGRSCFLWTWLFDDTTSIGIEFVRERIELARVNSIDTRMQWIETDFSFPEFKIPPTDIYYIYLSTGIRFDIFLRKIKKIQGSPHLVVVESHGDMFARLKCESWWLAQTDIRFKLFSKRHHPWGQVFQKSTDSMFFQLEESFETRAGILPSELKKHPSPMSYILSKSNQLNWELVIEDQNEKWTMDCLGIEWFNAQSIKGKNPPRQVSWEECIIGLRIIPDGEYGEWSKLRRCDRPMTFTTKDKRLEMVLIRKIFIQPEFLIEFSDGTRTKVSDILTREML